MENTENHEAYAARTAEVLTGGDLSEIDFDSLAAWLKEIVPRLSSVPALESDLASLRTDYTRRISGMLKAVAAVGKGDRDLRDALRTTESLENLTAEELIAQYHRTAAVFRDTFPASYGRLPRIGRPGRSDFADYR